MGRRAIFIIILVVGLLGASFIGRGVPGGSSPTPGNSSPTPGAYSAKPLSLDFLSLSSSDAPILDKAKAACTGTSKITLTWRPVPGASEYIVTRSLIAIGRVSTTEYVDSGVDLPGGLTPGVQYCYSVRSKTDGASPDGKSVVSGPSNTKCAVASSCTGGNITPPVGVTSVPTSTPTPSISTPTPTKTPTPTPPVSPECQSTTKMADGRRVINTKSFGSDGVAIQKALNCFKDPKYGGGAVYVPSGNYLVTDKIRVFSNVTLFGDGIDQTILQLDSALLTDPGGILANDTNYGHENIAVRDMTLKGLFKESGINNCCPGILLRQLEGGFLDKIKVEGFSWHGIRLAYLKQKEGGAKDTVKNVRISNCQILNNKGDGIALDSPTSYTVVDHCILQGNNHGTGDDKHGGAAINMFMDEDGLVTKNKILYNTVSHNSHRGIIVVARNNITAIKKTRIADNAVCNNIVTNNADVGVADGNSENSVYIANTINANNDTQNGKVTTGAIRFYDPSTLSWFTTPVGSSLKMIENESLTATNPDCAIPQVLATIPPIPPQVQGAAAVAVQDESKVYSPILDLFYRLFGGK